MERKKKVALAAPIPLENVDDTVNWQLCCICQKEEGILVCPAKNPIPSQRNVGYNAFASNVEAVRQSHPNYIFPCGRKADSYDEGYGVRETLIKHEAKWHKKCIIKYTTRFSLQNVAQLTLENTENVDGTTKAQTRSTSVAINPKEEVCFLCKKKPEKNQILHKCMTFEIFNSIKQYATKANDTKTLAFLSEGDLVAQEAKYHSCCVLNLYRKGKVSTPQQNKEDVTCESLAFADLLLYMHAQIEDNGKECAFNTGTLRKLYNDRLLQLLGSQERTLPAVHETRFREKILLHFPELQAVKSGREYVLMLKNANILPNMDSANEDLDALAVNRFVRNIRNNIFATDIRFTGGFEENCEENCIPPSLLALVNMMLYGSSIVSECRTTKPAITICQVILANMSKSRPSGNITRIKTAREPPLPLYLGLTIYKSSRDKNLIDNLHERGLSVSSNRVYELTANLARHVVQRAEEEGVVCPSVLQKGFFTVGALDNIDIKPSSTTSQGEFHGTGISLFQLPLHGDVSTRRTCSSTYEGAVKSGSRHVPSLPAAYSEPPEFFFPNTQPAPPGYSSDVYETVSHLAGAEKLWHSEKDWLDYLHNQLVENEPLFQENVSWSAFRAVRQGISPLSPAINSLLPLFDDKSTSPGMIKHGMDIIRKSTEFLNPGQTPVICVDQPLFATAKLLQWNLPAAYGEDKFVVLFGPLHIEQNFIRMMGELLEGSGWTGIIANSGILPAGSAEGLLKVSSITKSRLYHQYTAAALYSLLSDAYNFEHPDCDVAKEDWIRDNAERSPTFKFWLLVLRLEVLLLKFVRSVREAQFQDFKESIIMMLPWFFSLGHFLYARWLTVHACDLVALERNAPETYRRFSLGTYMCAFVVRKTLNAFSCLGIDHAHEQNNAEVKSRGGAVGLTQDPSALRRWTIAGPEVARLLNEFEGEKEMKPGVHHEQYPKFQANFFESCAAVKESFQQSENPFLIRGPELINLETRVQIDESCCETLNKLEENGRIMVKDFIEMRLKTQELSFYAPVKKHKCQIFSLKKSEKKTSTSDLKNDLQLFSRLFIVSLSRSLNLQLFFKHENQPCPPSLSRHGKLNSGDKSKLVPLLEKLVENIPTPDACDGIILDGAALVRMIKPHSGTSSFKEYSEQVNTYCAKLASRMVCQRLDVVWDQYNGKSLKTEARESRGSGVRRPGLPQKGAFPSKPKQWEDYLRNDCNKEELFQYLAESALKNEHLQIVTNVKDVIKVSPFYPQSSALENVCCALMEEADGRLLLHAKDMAERGSRTVIIRCSDTDIVVLAVSFFHDLQKIGLEELWVHYGVGVNKRFIAAHAIALKLGEERSSALRGFHTFSGCDSVSFFAGKGKRSAWGAWDSKDLELTQAFKSLASPTENVLSEATMSALERFVVTMYGAQGITSHVDPAREHLFATDGKPLLHIPPTYGVLVQHTRRAAYQAGQIWGRSLQTDWKNLPSPVGWGWKGTPGSWLPHWSDLDDIWQTCRELSVCGCASDCSTMRCACRKAGVCCALSCKKCKGNCSNVKNAVPESENEDVDGDLQEI
ncbi:Chromosome-associated kinesin KIF4 [Frankliniella fusca]|uniref:Chromosome-associated kinesin KIF4 n=1 Tax=Frankliniella fusca TaxID=407009 RepID=A0AAE1HAH5_9NEOP|nr:Chromosome-associated kinesin KIF4 [Frankliniella fusca]